MNVVVCLQEDLTQPALSKGVVLEVELVKSLVAVLVGLEWAAEREK